MICISSIWYKEAKRKRGKKNSDRRHADVPVDLFQSGVGDARDGIKYGRRCGVLLHKKCRGDWGLVISSHDRNGGKSRNADSFMPTGAFNICFPRDCVSRHNGDTSGAPLKPLRVDSALRALSTQRLR